MQRARIAIRTDGEVSAGAVLWRFRGRLQVTVVVKAVFRVLPDGVAVHVGPGEIVTEDRHLVGSVLRSVEAASDLAPYLPRCDVLFTGHAYGPAGAAAGAVRLGVARDGVRLLDKTIHVYGDRGPTGAPEPFARMPIVYERAVGGPGAPNPIGTDKPNLADPEDRRRPAGFGPISRRWPARAAVLGRIDRRTIEAPIAEIPEAMPWEFFQAAPPDQRIDPLRGGEWIVMDGLHPTQPRVQTRLPPARGTARVEGATGGAVELVCDTLAIDGDRQTLSLSWRGRYEVAEGEAALASLVVLAALEAPGTQVDWARVRAAAPLEAPAGPDASESALGTTMATSGPAPRAAMPFEPSAAHARPPTTKATPWGGQPLVPAPEVVQGDGTQAPGASPLRRGKVVGTMVLPAMGQDEPHTTGIPGAPWNRMAPPPPPPPPPPTGDTETAELEPLAPAELALIEEARAARPSSELPLPARTLPTPPPDPWARPLDPPPAPTPPSVPPAPPADPWARPLAPPAPTPPSAPPPPPAFVHPEAAAVKGSFYSKFNRK